MKKQFVSPSIKVIKAETSVICASEDMRKVTLHGLTWNDAWDN